jgi:hypothetical protein
MSTHALTVYISREYDGDTHDLGHLWRKFDGYPETHGADLKRLIGDRQYTSLWELMCAVSQLDVKVEGVNFNWMLLPVDPRVMDVEAQFVYYLSLVDDQGQLSRGDMWRESYNVHLTVKEEGRTLYHGLLRNYTPGETSNTGSQTSADHNPEASLLRRAADLLERAERQ